jgi:hypothetical protein
MALELAFTWVVALAVPVWLVVEELLIRRRSVEERPGQMASATREKSVLGPAEILSELPREAA